jgi:hypothetical protein
MSSHILTYHIFDNQQRNLRALLVEKFARYSAILGLCPDIRPLSNRSNPLSDWIQNIKKGRIFKATLMNSIK